ncbi:lasso peptide biosynthesis B2 protein [Kitasatospora sp. NPDC098663]|uniref:lasso peptide biosynthesis B2 protein n=1 Tax=Kitasatospora sp. NPDC098663 TaxID=3364096 RepID=UPI0037FEBBA8
MVTPSGAVHSCTSAWGTALMDTRHGPGTWRFLDPVGTDLWRAITSGVPADQAVDRLAAYWQQRGQDPDTVRADLTAVLAALRRADLLNPARQPIEAADAQPRVHFAAPGPTGLGLRLAAPLALAVTLVLLRLPIRYSIAAARHTTALPARPATVAQAQAAHYAVRRVARWWPGRVACLEESLAAFLTGALTGRRVRWVLGAAFLPRGAHAWTEAHGEIIGQEPADRVWRYLPVLQVGPAA